MKHAARLLAPALLLMLFGCSTTSLVYNRLHWLAGWEAGKYADLSQTQEELFEQRFAVLWDWHRSTELPAYAQDLRRVASLSEQPLDATQAAGIAQDYFAWWRRGLERASPELCTLLASFDAAQVESSLERIDRDIADDAEEYGLPERKLRAQSGERLVKSLRPWLGPLTDEQRAGITAWSARRELTYDVWLDNRRAWRERFASELQSRNEGPDFCARLDQLLLAERPVSEAARARQARSRADWIELAVQLSAQLTPAQRLHFRDELLAKAAEVEKLAAQRRR